MKTVRVAAGSAFWGDMIEPSLELAARGDVRYIGFDFLAELTMALLQRAKLKDPNAGYIPDVVTWMERLMPIAHPRGIKLVSNGGGANVQAAGEALAAAAARQGLRGIKIATVWGDDLFPRLGELRAQGLRLRNLDTGEEDLDRIWHRVVAANVYVGADSIVDALRAGADVVVTGRASDNALFVGPLMHEFGWDYSEPYRDRVASAIAVGHLLECGANATGGMSGQWEIAPEMWNLGFPIAEVEETGDAVITKLEGTGGIVNQWTIKEQFVYEVHDPANYYMPDGVADFTSLRVQEVGKDRVRISGVKGKPRPDSLKLNIGFENGWIAEGLLMFPWPKAYQRARKAEEILRHRFEKLHLKADAIQMDYLGVNSLLGSTAGEPDPEINEVGLRIAVKTQERGEAEKVRREIPHLWNLGPVGTAFWLPFKPRPVVSLWPTLVPRELVRTEFALREV